MPREGVRASGMKPILLERQRQDIQYRDEDRPAKEGRIAVEVSVNYAEKTSYFRNICAEIADFAFLQLVLLARSSLSCFTANPYLLGLLFSTPSLLILDPHTAYYFSCAIPPLCSGCIPICHLSPSFLQGLIVLWCKTPTFLNPNLTAIVDLFRWISKIAN